MDVTIRRVLLKDAAALAEISRQTFYNTFTGTCTEDDMQSFLEQYFNVAQVQTELTNADDYYFFAEVDGRPVGYIRFMEDYNNWELVKKWKALELKRLYVIQQYHGKGIAQQLMDFFILFAQQNKYQLLWLGVWEHNVRAQKFYEKYGFADSGHRHDFPIGNTAQTDKWLWKFLE